MPAIPPARPCPGMARARRRRGLFMHDPTLLAEILIFLVAAVAVASVLQRLRSSLVVGYLVAGVVIGPEVLGLVSETPTVRGLAELGVVFLLFTIGLELSVERLRVIRNQIFGLGTAQVALTGATVGGIALAAGFPFAFAVVVGAGLALSSTAIVAQLLSERGQTTTRHGRLAFAILLLQDLAVVPLLALVAALAADGRETGASVLLSLGTAVLALAGVAVAGRLVLRPLLRLFAVGHRPELFAAVTLVVLLGMSWLTASLGLSLAIGGFLAGVLLAETEYRHQVAADIKPFLGLLLGLFFMTVGLGLSLRTIVDHAPTVLALVLGLFVLKGAIIHGLCRVSGISSGMSAGTAFLLGGAGEFGFVIFAMAFDHGILGPRDSSVLAAVIVASMALTPLAFSIGRRLRARLDTRPADDGEQMHSETVDLTNHVVIAGFGRVGLSLSRTLAAAEIPYVAIEFQPARVEAARAGGLPVYYGDAGRLEVLEAAGIARARAAVIILDDADATERTVHLLHGRHPHLAVHARARDNDHMRRLAAAGARDVVHETYEMSLQIGETVLREYGTGEDRIHGIIDAHRRHEYALLSEGILPAERPGDGGRGA